jgi:hypothetical protein
MSDRQMMRLALLGLAATLAACGGPRGRAPATRAGSGAVERPEEFDAPSSPARARMIPRNGLEVIGAMRRAHPSRELRSLAFTVSTEDGDATAPALARAIAELPGKYRVTDLPSSRRSGVVRNYQKMTVFNRGRRVASQNRVDLAMLLAFDVFAQGIDTTIKWLDVARVRFGVTRRDEFAGRDVWVVGALEGDTLSAQFWVDADRWHVLRVIQRDPRSPKQLVDVRFTGFTEYLDIPVPTRITTYRGGKLEQQQVITNVAVNVSVPASAFDLTKWREVKLGN